MGVASGTTAISSFVTISACSAGLGVLTCDDFPSRRLNAIRKRRIPPAIRNASSVIPKTLRMRWPNIEKNRTKQKAIKVERRARHLCSAIVCPLVKAIKIGILAIGFMIAKMDMREDKKKGASFHYLLHGILVMLSYETVLYNKISKWLGSLADFLGH